MPNGSRCKSIVAVYDETEAVWIVKIDGHKYAFGVIIWHLCPDCGHEFGKRPACLAPPTAERKQDCARPAA